MRATRYRHFYTCKNLTSFLRFLWNLKQYYNQCKSLFIWGGPQASLNIQHHVCVWVAAFEWLSNRQKPQNTIYGRAFKLYRESKFFTFHKKITKLWPKMWRVCPKNGDWWKRSRKSNVIRENFDGFSENVRKISIFRGKSSHFVS